MDAPLYRKCLACSLERPIFEFCVFAAPLPCGHGLDVCAGCVCERTRARGCPSCPVCDARLSDAFVSVAESLAQQARIDDAPLPPVAPPAAPAATAAASASPPVAAARVFVAGEAQIVFLFGEPLAVAVTATTTVGELIEAAARRLEVAPSRVNLAVRGGHQSICLLPQSTAASVGVRAGATLVATLPLHTQAGGETRPLRFSLSYARSGANAPFMDVMAVVVGPDERLSVSVTELGSGREKEPAGVSLAKHDGSVSIDVRASELHASVRAVFFVLAGYQGSLLNQGGLTNVRAVLERRDADGATQLASVSMADLPAQPVLIVGALRRIRSDDGSEAIEFIEIREPSRLSKLKDLKRTLVERMDQLDAHQ